jgi:hypothetical protein
VSRFGGALTSWLEGTPPENCELRSSSGEFAVSDGGSWTAGPACADRHLPVRPQTGTDRPRHPPAAQRSAGHHAEQRRITRSGGRGARLAATLLRPLNSQLSTITHQPDCGSPRRPGGELRVSSVECRICEDSWNSCLGSPGRPTRELRMANGEGRMVGRGPLGLPVRIGTSVFPVLPHAREALEYATSGARFRAGKRHDMASFTAILAQRRQRGR